MGGVLGRSRRRSRQLQPARTRALSARCCARAARRPLPRARRKQLEAHILYYSGHDSGVHVLTIEQQRALVLVETFIFGLVENIAE